MGFLDSLLGLNQGQPLIDAANQNKTAIGTYNTTANNIIDTGANAAQGYLGQANNLYAPLAQEGQAAGNMYANSLGLNGAAGNAAATAAYQASPGYQFTMDQGLQALDRTAAGNGQLGGGGLTADTLKYATGLANQDYGNWQSQLGSTSTAIGSAIPGETGVLTNLGNLATNTAGAKTDVAGSVLTGTEGANNQVAAGQQQNNAGLSSLFSNILGIGGKILGYGGF